MITSGNKAFCKIILTAWWMNSHLRGFQNIWAHFWTFEGSILFRISEEAHFCFSTWQEDASSEEEAFMATIHSESAQSEVWKNLLSQPGSPWPDLILLALHNLLQFSCFLFFFLKKICYFLLLFGFNILGQFDKQLYDIIPCDDESGPFLTILQKCEGLDETRGLPCRHPFVHTMNAVFTKATWRFAAGKFINQRAAPWWLCSLSPGSGLPSLNKNNIQKHLFLICQQLQFCLFSESTFPLWILRLW